MSGRDMLQKLQSYKLAGGRSGIALAAGGCSVSAGSLVPTQLPCLTWALRHGNRRRPRHHGRRRRGRAGQHLTLTGRPKVVPTCQYTMLAARFVANLCMIRLHPSGWVFLE